MEIGYCKVNITPPILTCSNGGMFDDPKDFHLGVHDELYARAIVFKDGDKKAAIVSADLINLPRYSVNKIKKIIKQQTDIPPENVILHALHPHSGPFSFRFKKGIRNDAYWTITEQKLAGALFEAQNDMKEFFVGSGKSTLDYTLNRRILMEDGKVLYLPQHPGLKPNQVVDNEIGVVSFRKMDNRPLITLINYSCHPLTIGPVPRLISADYPGAVVKHVEKNLFGSAVYTNGACANIHPQEHCEGFAAMDNFGTALGDKVLEEMPFIQKNKAKNLRTLYDTIPLDLIPEKVDQNEDIKEFRNGTIYDLDITIIALNDIAFIGIPVEYFVELQLDIKSKSPIKNTFLLTLSNGCAGYMPDERAYPQGGMEVDATKFTPGSGEKVRDKILEMLGKVA